MHKMFPVGSAHSLVKFMQKLNEIIYRCSINSGSFHPFPKAVLGQSAVFRFTSQGSVAVVIICNWTVHTWFSRTPKSPNSYPKKTLAILEYLSELAAVHQVGVGQIGGCWLVPSQLLPTHTTSSWDFETGPRSPTARVVMGSANPQSWEGEGRGIGVSSLCLLWSTVFK